MDAKTLSYTDLSDNSTGTLRPNGDCRYITVWGTANLGDVVVSPAGVLVSRNMTNGVYRIAIGFPEQAHTVAELAGTWNSIGRELVSGDPASNNMVYGGVMGTWTVSSAGAVSGINYCNPITSCADLSGKTINYSLNATVTPSTGGFDLVSTTPGDTWTDRVYAYKSGSGEMMLIDVSGDGGFSVSTKKVDGAVSAVDGVASSWGVWSGINGVSSGLVSESTLSPRATTRRRAVGAAWPAPMATPKP